MAWILPSDAGAENEWLRVMSSSVSLGNGEHSGLREKKFPGDLQSLEYLPPHFFV
jgi:hypothetical protein